MPVVRRATTDADLEAVRRLFIEYARSLPFALDFQNFQAELHALPGEYAPPQGCILLSEAGSNRTGCVALRPLAPNASDPPDTHFCEMKRLYVRPSYRGRGVGRALAEAVLDEGHQRGYDAMRLDTVASMTAANKLYRSLGFREISPYRHNPLDDPVFFEKRLSGTTNNLQ